MATIQSPLRTILKPLFFKLIGKKGYLLMQYFAKKKDIEDKLLDEPEMELLPFLVSKNSNVIDIGANYAYYTHRLANICSNGKVYAFEPIPFTFEVAKKIVASFSFKNVYLFQFGVGNENITTKFEVPLQDFGAYSAGQAHLKGRNNELAGKEQHYKFKNYEEVECRIIRIDDFKEIGGKIDFVKMDIEGAELFALKGMKNVLLNDKPTILLEINPFFLEGFKIKEQELNSFIAEVGYRTFIYEPECKKLSLFKGAYIESNYILIHQSRVEEFSKIIRNE